MTLEESIAINLAALQQKKDRRGARPIRTPRPTRPARKPFDDGWGSTWRHAYRDRYFEQLFGYEKPESQQNA